MDTGPLRHYVALANTSDFANGIYSVIPTPSHVWCAIESFGPQNNDRTLSHLVRMRYHPQVGLDTKITLGARQFFVKGVQNVDERNVELRLLCEEVV